MKHLFQPFFIPSPRLEASREWILLETLRSYETTIKVLLEKLEQSEIRITNDSTDGGTNKADDIANRISQGKDALGGEAQISKLTPKEALARLRNIFNTKSLTELDIKKALALLVTYKEVVTRTRVQRLSQRSGEIDRKLAVRSSKPY